MDSIVIIGECGIEKFSWVLFEDRLAIRDKSGRSEKVIPLSNIKSVTFAYARWGGGGRIDIDIGAGPSSFIKLTGSVTVSDSGKEFLIFKKDCTKNAELIRDYINNFLCNLSSVNVTNSLADELVKLKALLDQGALSPEEFEAAKKKLLDA